LAFHINSQGTAIHLPQLRAFTKFYMDKILPHIQRVRRHKSYCTSHRVDCYWEVADVSKDPDAFTCIWRCYLSSKHR